MIEIEVPGFKPLRIFHLVFDYNRDCDGKITDGVEERLKVLAKVLEIHVLTADTFGSVAKELSSVPCKISVIPKGDQTMVTTGYVRKLGPERSVATRNPRRKRIMESRMHILRNGSMIGRFIRIKEMFLPG
jgi:soluble P-type ATPase